MTQDLKAAIVKTDPARLVKISIAAIVAMLHFIYAAQNIVNASAVYDIMAYAFSMADHAAYPASIGPPITQPALVWLCFGVIVAAEFTTALLAGFGAARLWAARGKRALAFNAAKGHALLGAGLGMIIWFGFFMTVGGGYFQMWQTPVGQGSLNGAFQFGVFCAAAFLIIAMKDEDSSDGKRA